jgi:hypothetical protein
VIDEVVEGNSIDPNLWRGMPCAEEDRRRRQKEAKPLVAKTAQECG